MPPLRYSDRRREAEAGTLGPLDYDTIPDGLRVAVRSIYETAAKHSVAGRHVDARIAAAFSQHFGRKFYKWSSQELSIGHWLESKYSGPSVDDLLDAVEILIDESVHAWNFTVGGQEGSYKANAEAENQINRAFVRHRFGYAVDGGQVRRLGSVALDDAIVGPALLATRRPGWEEVDRSYRDALHHQRGGPDERAAAITDAHAALEAALKAGGLKGDRLSALAKSFRNSGLVPAQLEGVPEALDLLLKRSSSIRDPLGDAHGKGPDADPVPDGVVDLAIYWTGAFINYLSDATAANSATSDAGA